MRPHARQVIGGFAGDDAAHEFAEVGFDFTTHERGEARQVQPLPRNLMRRKIWAAKQQWNTVAPADLAQCGAMRVVHQICRYKHGVEALLQTPFELGAERVPGSRELGCVVGRVLGTHLPQQAVARDSGAIAKLEVEASPPRRPRFPRNSAYARGERCEQFNVVIAGAKDRRQVPDRDRRVSGEVIEIHEQDASTHFQAPLAVRRVVQRSRRGTLVPIMRPVGYLVNRYPEATLTTIRREIEAVTAAGVPVVRFAHRPSDQPLADPVDQREADQTEYVALTGLGRLALCLLRTMVSRPRRFFSALRAATDIEPSISLALAYLALACWINRRLEARGIGTLHVHFGLTSAAVGILVRELGGRPWSVTIHGPEEFAERNQKRLVNVVRSADRTVVISRSAAAEVKRAVAPAAIEPTVIAMGVGSEFLRPPVPIDANAPIVCIARLDARKGHAVLLDALARIELEYRQFRVELIGDGPLRSDIEAEISRAGLVGRVIMRGWQSEKAIKEALDRSRFLVLPSLDEGLPVAIMESFARARPVIATSVAGVPEIVLPQISGVLVPPNDAASLAKGLTELLSVSESELYQLGLNGRRLVRERFDSARNAHALIAMWQEMGNR